MIARGVTTSKLTNVKHPVLKITLSPREVIAISIMGKLMKAEKKEKKK